MKVKILLFALVATLAANGQYLEDFENGVPGSMIQKFQKEETTWIDFGLSAIDVERPLSGSNSAVFFNGLATNETSTSLETPILDLSLPNPILEFKYLLREKTPGYVNKLIVEISNDFGVTWNTIGSFTNNFDTMKNESIDLSRFKPTKTSIIRFKAVQPKVDLGYPVVIDDIAISFNSNSAGEYNRKTAQESEFNIYPNPSNGIFNIKTNQNVDVTVIDINGKVVYEISQISNEAQINLSTLQKGIYMVKIKSAQSEKIEKIIIK